MLRAILIICFLLISLPTFAQPLRPAVTKTISTSELVGFSDYPENVKEVIKDALKLAGQKLTYMYGSANPNNKGMDCSGTIHYVLQKQDLKEVPRQANLFYLWVEKRGKLYTVNSHDFSSRQFSHLKPGDLLFWTGTYNVHRDPPITHVMMYLGKNKEDEPLMFGASDGRTYQGKSMWGVSVFDFVLPDEYSKAQFVGYGCVPNLTCK